MEYRQPSLPSATDPGAIEYASWHVDQDVIDFFCPGRVPTRHDAQAIDKRMTLSEHRFLSALDNAMAVLDSHGIAPAARSEVLAILRSLRSV
jgi:hypothetical protein